MIFCVKTKKDKKSVGGGKEKKEDELDFGREKRKDELVYETKCAVAFLTSGSS